MSLVSSAERLYSLIIVLISDWVNIKRSTLQKLADVLEVSPLYILDFEEVPNTESNAANLTKPEEEHIEKYRFIDDKGKYTVDTVLDMEYLRCSNIVLINKETSKKNMNQQKMI